MKPLRSSTIKEVSETVECDNGNAYTRTEKWKFFMRDYVLESIEWRDMFDKEIATHKQNVYFKTSSSKYGTFTSTLKDNDKYVIKFKELEREYKLMKVLNNE